MGVLWVKGESSVAGKEIEGNEASEEKWNGITPKGRQVKRKAAFKLSPTYL